MNVVMFGFNDWHEWSLQGFRTRSARIARSWSIRADRTALSSFRLPVVLSPTAREESNRTWA